MLQLWGLQKCPYFSYDYFQRSTGTSAGVRFTRHKRLILLIFLIIFRSLTFVANVSAVEIILAITSV